MLPNPAAKQVAAAQKALLSAPVLDKGDLAELIDALIAVEAG